MDIMKRAAQLLADNVSPRIVPALSPLYYRYQQYSADRAHVVPRRTLDRRPDAPDHVLLLVIDALRPDVMPALPIEFTTGIAPSTWTFPSVTSVHTGTYPHEHGAVAHTRPSDEEYALPRRTASEPILPASLEATGYRTLSACALMIPHLATRSWYRTNRVFRSAPAERVVSTYRRWRSGRDRTFAYLHFGDVREPIEPPRPYVEARDVDTSLPNLGGMAEYTDTYDGSERAEYFREHRLRLYRAALDYVEAQLRPLIDAIGDDTLIVLAGDHGEAHWEHYELDRRITDSRPNYGVGHGGTPFDAVARVPVGVSSSDRECQPRGGWASLRDVPRTILSAVRENVNASGYDWHEPIPMDRIALCEGTRYGVERKAAYQGEYKLIRSEADDVTLTASIDRADGETFVDIPQARREALCRALPNFWEDFDTTRAVGPALEGQLEALGYK